MNGLDLFSGCGGLTLALAPWVRPAAYCEIDPAARAVLLGRMADGELPIAPIWDDVRTLRGRTLPPPLTSSTADSRAKTSASLALAQVWTESEAAFSSRSCDLQMRFSRYSCSWKTSLGFDSTPTEFSQSWPRAGTMRDGCISRLLTSERRTSVNDGGVLLPTPTSSRNGGYNQSDSPNAAIRPSLEMMAAKNLWPTPQARDGDKRRGAPGPSTSLHLSAAALLSSQDGGQLNPTWVEWLMGYPIGWTVLPSWATRSFRNKRERRSLPLPG